MYWKLSIRNARRSFKNYLLYIVTMTVLLAVMEVSNCIAVMAGFSDFQTASLPLLIIVIQIILVGYIDTFLFKLHFPKIQVLFSSSKILSSNIFLIKNICSIRYIADMFITPF